MCKGLRGDRWGWEGGPTGPGGFGGGQGFGGGRVGAGAAPHPGGFTRIVQPRESSRECRGEGGSPGRGCSGFWGGRGNGDKLFTAGGVPAKRGERGAGPPGGAPRCPRLLLGCARSRPRFGCGGHPPREGWGVTLPPRPHLARARRGGGPGDGGDPPTPLCKSARGGVSPLCITGNEP